jgi:uncharacterized membrane protein
MARDRRRSARLDQPLETRRLLVPRPNYAPDAFGRLAELIARFIGTSRFLAAQTALIALWIGVNAPPLATYISFDPYPFPFLTLILSLQAAYAAPLILLSQNRQDDRDRVNLEHDRAQGVRAHADTQYLTREVAALRIALGDVATRDFVRSELRDLLGELDERTGHSPALRPNE